MDADEMHNTLEAEGWYYDNGWSFNNMHWGCYVRNDSLDVRILELWPKMVILRKTDTQEESALWQGRVETREMLMQVIKDANSK